MSNLSKKDQYLEIILCYLYWHSEDEINFIITIAWSMSYVDFTSGREEGEYANKITIHFIPYRT